MQTATPSILRYPPINMGTATTRQLASAVQRMTDELDRATVFDPKEKEDVSLSPLVGGAHCNIRTLAVELSTPYIRKDRAEGQEGYKGGSVKILEAYRSDWEERGTRARYLALDDNSKPMDAFGAYVDYTGGARIGLLQLLMFPKALLARSQETIARIVAKHVDIQDIKGVNKSVYAIDTVQRIYIQLTNMAHYDRTKIAQDILSLYARPLANKSDVEKFRTDLYELGFLKNILD